MTPISPLVLRIPTYSLNELKKLNASIIASNDNFIPAVLALRNKELFMDALYYASSRLYEVFMKAHVDDNDEKTSKICISVYKYFVRMCSRATPFGLFAGVSLAEIGDNPTEINLNTDKKGTAFIRYDISLMLSFSEELMRDERLKKKVRYYTNNSIHSLRENIRYVESEYVSGAKNYLISDLERFPLLDYILKKFDANGGGNFQDFIGYLKEQEIDLTIAEEFFADLIKNQILKSELELNVAGEFYLNRVSRILNSFSGIDDIKRKIESLKKILLYLENGSLRPGAASEELKTSFNTLVAYNNYHVDYKINLLKRNINEKVVQDLTKKLQKIISFLSQPVRNISLDDFKNKFIERYGEKEISLALLLDPDLGIAYSETRVGKSPLIENILRTNKQKDYSYGAVSHIKSLFMNKLIQRKQVEIEITDSDILEFEKNFGDIFQSQSPEYYVLGSMISESSEEMDNLNYQFEVKTLVNGNAANLMARFGHLGNNFGEYIREQVNRDTVDEIDWIDAEIVHLNSGEGNIVIRPSFVDYEIPFACLSTKESDFQLQISDLYVSLKNNTFVLRSKKHDKYVRARLRNAHNFTTGLPIYKFLCDIQSQGHASKLNWDWGLLSEIGISPRITYKTIILSKAKWRITKNSFSEFSLENLQKFLNALKAEKHLPNLITLDVGDNELLLDLNLKLSQEILYSSLKSAGVITVSEYINKDFNSFIKQGDDNFANEILLSFSATSTSKINSAIRIAKQVPKEIKKTLLPFENCLSLKIYCGERIAEYILTNELVAVLKKFTSQCKSNYWFFIRYHDPESHLRIRLFSEDRSSLMNSYQMIEKKIAPYVQDNIIYSFQIDSYKREFERYGRESILSFEQLFFRESCLITTLLKIISNQTKNENHRVYCIIKLCDIYLNQYYKSVKDKLRFSNMIKNNFISEFKDVIYVKESLKLKYKEYKPYISLLSDGNMKVLDDIGFRKLLKHLIDFEREIVFKTDFIKTESQLASVIHMSINRLFISEQRLHELFIYDILENYYKSSIARSKKLTYA